MKTIPDSCSELNTTDWYKVTITDVTDEEVSFNAVWRFINGTEKVITGKVNIKTGQGNSVDFWAIYASGLGANDYARPLITDGLTINATETRTYKSGERETNRIFLERVLYDYEDPTFARTLNDYLSIYFDKQTGMLVELINTQLYSEPALRITFIWKLVESTAWEI